MLDPEYSPGDGRAAVVFDPYLRRYVGCHPGVPYTVAQTPEACRDALATFVAEAATRPAPGARS
jgi:hypothetical protein